MNLQHEIARTRLSMRQAWTGLLVTICVLLALLFVIMF